MLTYLGDPLDCRHLGSHCGIGLEILLGLDLQVLNKLHHQVGLLLHAVELIVQLSSCNTRGLEIIS